jgi:mersacidin/lichenicidin family type 2 lantibiotic
MSNFDIIRAWKDEEFRNSLSEEQLKQLPENPAGVLELSDEEMEALAGGKGSSIVPSTTTGSKNPPCQCSCVSCGGGGIFLEL